MVKTMSTLKHLIHCLQLLYAPTIASALTTPLVVVQVQPVGGGASFPASCGVRLVCRELQAAVAAHPWEDRETVILGSIGAWRACFPRARCANVQ